MPGPLEPLTTSDAIPESPLKIGLIGTGYWADQCHAEGISRRNDLEFVGVWGRDSSKTAEFANRRGIAPFDSPEALFAAVDVVSFAVPPTVQAALAPIAAAAGCHLLLEKPIATSAKEADLIALACRENDVLSIVNFASLLGGSTGPWVKDVVAGRDWDGGHVTLLSDLRASDSPFAASPWRQLDNGSLWDVGPHALSLLVAGLGPVVDVQARHGRGDNWILSLRHAEGAVSSVLLSFTVGEGGGKFDVDFWGASGSVSAPPPVDEWAPVDNIIPALDLLARAIRSGTPVAYDAAFGADIVRVLAAAEIAATSN